MVIIKRLSGRGKVAHRWYKTISRLGKTRCPDASHGESGPHNPNRGFSWRVFILPYVEQNRLWDQLSLLDPTSAGCSSSTWKAIPQHQTIIDTHVCPSETSRRIVAGYTGSYSPGTAAIANYSGSAGPVAVYTRRCPFRICG
ncbi:MAG: DUF1559 domain-containing protein [Planctomycetia bacterium]